MKKYDYPFKNKLKFYWIYFYSKVIRIWYEVKKPKFKMFTYEIIYSVGKLFRFEVPKSTLFKIKYVETTYGRYNIRPNTMDIACVSPAFERTDIDEMGKLIDQLVAEKRKITFLDIGSDFGLYTVFVGNKLKKHNTHEIHAFEPVKDSYTLLKSNVNMNKMRNNVSLHNCALSNQEGRLTLYFDPNSPGSSGIGAANYSPAHHEYSVKTEKLDSVLTDNAEHRTLVVKIDVEGFEENVMLGAKKTFQNNEVYLLVEDFVDIKIINYLESNNYVFLKKLSPYNSWWYRLRNEKVQEIEC